MAEKINFSKTVRAAKNGSTDALQDLYDSTINDVTAICRKLLNSSSDPDSVIVDTYLSIFESLDTLKSPKQFPLYAAKAAATQCYNANQLRPAGAVDNGSPTTALDVVENALDNLNNGQRTSLLLQSHGMETSEIADVLGVTEYTVNSDIYFGCKKLQKAITASRSAIDFSGYGTGNEVIDNLLAEYGNNLYTDVPTKVRSSQFNQIMDIVEGKANAAKVDEPIAPKFEAAPAERPTIVEEPKTTNMFFHRPEQEEPTQVIPPVQEAPKQSAPRKKSNFRQPDLRQVEIETEAAPKAPRAAKPAPERAERVASGSSNTKKVLVTILIVLLVAVLGTLIGIFASRIGGNKETTTAPSAYSYFETQSTTESTTQSVARTFRETEPETEASTTAAPQTQAPQTQAPHTQAGPAESGGEAGVVAE